jgi:hypothetical protein
MRWPGKSGGFLNYETWQRSRSARGVEPSSRPAGWGIFASDGVREGSGRQVGRLLIDAVGMERGGPVVSSMCAALVPPGSTASIVLGSSPTILSPPCL